jgi:hypothetical protein
MIDVDVRTYHRAIDRRTRSKLFLRSFAGMAVTVLIVIGISKYTQRGSTPFTMLDGFALLGITLPIIGLLQWRQAGKLVVQLAAYQLTLGPNILRMTSSGMVPFEALRDEITAIVETRRGLFVTHRGRRFVIPRDLEGYDVVRAQLDAWCPIQSAGRRERRERVLQVAFLGLWGCACFVPHVPLPLLVALVVMILAMCAWSVPAILRSGFDSKMKALQILVLAVLCFQPVMRLIGEVMLPVLAAWAARS